MDTYLENIQGSFKELDAKELAKQVFALVLFYNRFLTVVQLIPTPIHYINQCIGHYHVVLPLSKVLVM